MVNVSWDDAAEFCEWLGKQGVKNTQPMNLGGGIDLPFGRVKLTLAHHSSVLPDGSGGVRTDTNRPHQSGLNRIRIEAVDPAVNGDAVLQPSHGYESALVIPHVAAVK